MNLVKSNNDHFGYVAGVKDIGLCDWRRKGLICYVIGIKDSHRLCGWDRRGKTGILGFFYGVVYLNGAHLAWMKTKQQLQTSDKNGCENTMLMKSGNEVTTSNSLC